MSSAKGNLTITVARKPIGGTVAANALEWGTGGINIDASRVGTLDKVTLHPNLSIRERGVRRMYDGGDIPPITEEHQTAGQALGRWPTNVILIHNAGCKRVGAKKVKTSQLNQVISRSRSSSESIGKQTDGFCRGFADSSGMETVDAWECVEGCPVAELDEQSGLLTSGSGTVKRRSSVSREGNQGAAYGAENRAEGTPMIFYGDTGGASRFFKQFQSEE